MCKLFAASVVVMAIGGATSTQAAMITNGDFSVAPTTVGSWVGGTGALDTWIARGRETLSEPENWVNLTRTSGQNVGWVEYLNSPGEYFAWVATGSGPGMFQAIEYPGAGAQLTIRFDHAAKSTVNDYVTLRLMGVNTGANIPIYSGGAEDTGWGDVLFRYEPTRLASWRSAEQTVTLSGNYDYLVIQFSRTGGFVDNVSMIPEPASLSVLALGVLALRRRRR
jgi:hypothetical protein